MRDRALKHGARALQERLSANTLDGRTGVAKLLKMTREDLAADGGGWESLTKREQILIDRTAAIIIILSSIEGYVFKQPSLVDDKGALLPALGTHYLAFQNSLRLNLAQLGLKPPSPDPDGDLDKYIQQRAKETTE